MKQHYSEQRLYLTELKYEPGKTSFSALLNIRLADISKTGPADFK